jgi:hypothetical protein
MPHSRIGGAQFAIGAVAAIAGIAALQRSGSANYARDDFPDAVMDDLKERKERGDGFPLDGWTIYQDWGSGALFWEPNDGVSPYPSLAATPFWEGNPGIAITLDDHKGLYENYDLVPAWTGGLQRDIELYYQEMIRFIEALTVLRELGVMKSTIDELSSLSRQNFNRGQLTEDQAASFIAQLSAMPPSRHREAIIYLAVGQEIIKRRLVLGGRHAWYIGQTRLEPEKVLQLGLNR